MEQSGTAKKASGQLFETWLLSFAEGHGGIQSIEKASTSGLVDTYRITMSDGSQTSFPVTNGNGITGISWATSGTSGNGQVHTGTISYSDGTTSTIAIKDGVKGNTGVGAYVWIRYASRNPVSNADMGTNPDKWMGIYSGSSSTAPTSYSSYAWYEIKGETGATGAAASVSSTETVYQTSGSGTTVPSGSWSSNIPQVNPGEYLWTKITVRFNTGNPVIWYSVAYAGVNGEGAVSTVNNAAPDPSGNVALTASDIPASSGTVQSAIDAKQASITATGVLKGNGSGTVAQAVKGTDYGARTFTVTLSASGWSSNAQNVSNSLFVTSGFAYLADPNSASRDAYIKAGVYADDVTTANRMTFHCKTVPTADLTVRIVRLVTA